MPDFSLEQSSLNLNGHEVKGWSDDADEPLTFADGARIEVKMKPYKVTAGVWTFGDLITDDMGFTTGTIAAGGESLGDDNTNASDLFNGIEGTLKLTADLASNGTAKLFIESSPDDVFWPSEADDFDIEKHLTEIVALDVSTTGLDKTSAINFEF